jgi:Flp pilus assembly protein TadD
MSALRNLAAVVLLAIVFSATAGAQDADELFRQGSRLFAEHQWDAARGLFQRVVELRPGDAQAWKALGVISASLGDFEAAETPFRNACERQPSLADACLYYGRTLYLLDRFQPAVQILRRTLQKERNSAEGYRLLALSLEGLGQSEEAAQAFRQAIGMYRGGLPDEDPGIDYGVFLFRQGSAEAALEPLEGALKRHPDSARAHLELGCILLSLDRLNDAALHLERSLALDPQKARAHLLLGKVYLRLGKSEAGEEHLRQGSRTAR